MKQQTSKATIAELQSLVRRMTADEIIQGISILNGEMARRDGSRGPIKAPWDSRISTRG